MAEQAGDKHKWEGVASWWGKINPPYSPSIDELKIYERVMKEISKKNPRMLVLGATPSLREMGYKLGFEVTIIDINPQMVEETNKLLDEKNPNEKVIIGSWLEVELDGKFDIIVGDHSTNNVDYEDWDKLFERIKNYLTDEGIVILGATVYGKEKLDWDELIGKIKKNPGLLENRFDRWKLRYDFHSHPDVRKDREYHCDWFDKGIEELYKQGRITQEECEKLKFKFGIWAATFVSKDEFKGFAEKYFKIIEIDFDRTHPFFEYQQFFILKKLTG